MSGYTVPTLRPTEPYEYYIEYVKSTAGKSATLQTIAYGEHQVAGATDNKLAINGSSSVLDAIVDCKQQFDMLLRDTAAVPCPEAVYSVCVSAPAIRYGLPIEHMSAGAYRDVDYEQPLLLTQSSDIVISKDAKKYIPNISKLNLVIGYDVSIPDETKSLFGRVYQLVNCKGRFTDKEEDGLVSTVRTDNVIRLYDSPMPPSFWIARLSRFI